MNGGRSNRAPRRAEHLDDLFADDVDEAAGAATAGAHLGHMADAMYLSAAGLGDQTALAGADDELADDEADDEQHDGGLEVVAAVDREGVVGLGEEEVERQRGDDRGDETASTSAEKRGREHGKHENERRVGRTDLTAERDHDTREGERRADRDDPTGDADSPLACKVARFRAHVPLIRSLNGPPPAPNGSLTRGPRDLTRC